MTVPLHPPNLSLLFNSGKLLLKMTLPIFLALLVATAVHVHGLPAGGGGVKQESRNVVVTSVLDGKVITSTDFLEDPGPYNIYATRAEDDEGKDTQRWSMYIYEDEKRFSIGANGGQFWNTFSIYKGCPDCYATNEFWVVQQVGMANVQLKSTWTGWCLANPGGDYLKKVNCNVNDVGQRWTIKN